jgi:hypothetical protein
MKRYIVQLTQDQVLAARILGDGNLSRGVRKCITFTFAALSDVALPADDTKPVSIEIAITLPQSPVRSDIITV